jgi:hypothetical protein
MSDIQNELASIKEAERLELENWRWTADFRADEFACPCCGCNEMDMVFIQKLQQARSFANIPFNINSGWRCMKHNREVGGSDHSSHLLGVAADIQATTSRQRGLILPALYRAGFTRIGLTKTFIHCDTDIHKEQNVTWFY